MITLTASIFMPIPSRCFWRPGTLHGSGSQYLSFLCVVATLPFAVASWWFVEKRALRLEDIGPRQLVQESSDPSRDPTRPRPDRAPADTSGGGGESKPEF